MPVHVDTGVLFLGGVRGDVDNAQAIPRNISTVSIPGQRNNAPLLAPVLKRANVRVPEIEEAVADKGFDGQPQPR